MPKLDAEPCVPFRSRARDYRPARGCMTCGTSRVQLFSFRRIIGRYCLGCIETHLESGETLPRMS